MQGWIKLHRQLTEWEWYTDHKTFKLWIHLLLTANIVPHKKMLGYTLSPGQLITTLPRLAAETGLSEKETRNALKRLIDGGEISEKTTTKFRLITIEKWVFYQSESKGIDRQAPVVRNEKSNGSTERPKKYKNRFINYPQSVYDFDYIEKMEREIILSEI